MTRNDILNRVDAEKKIELIFEKWNYCCRNSLAKSKAEEDETWLILCRTKFRGDPYNPSESCRKCRAEFLNEDIGEEFGMKLLKEGE